MMPLGDDEFAARMARLGPFESCPALAVGVSGGADSLALCLLAERWARSRGGRAVGITVDHGLRSESAEEAATVGGWLAERGIGHVTLSWTGDKPSTGLQAAAREARYALLGKWCRDAGVLHLLLAHHQDDQAETLLLRLARGSGVDGLSAMAPATAAPDAMIWRPLLDVPHARLMATLEQLGQIWIEDSSNTNMAFKRVRLRRMMPGLAGEGLNASRLAATAGRLRRARGALEHAATALLVEAVQLHPAGFARLDSGLLASAPEEISLRALAQLCRTIGGGVYPPRLERLERIHGVLRRGLPARRTFAGCVLAPTRLGVLVCREPAALASPVTVRAGDKVLWDGRFTLRLGGQGEGRVAALGQEGWRAVREQVECVKDGRSVFPAIILSTIPAVMDRHGVCSVPHLGYKREMPRGLTVDQVAFTPACPLAGAGHCLV